MKQRIVLFRPTEPLCSICLKLKTPLVVFVAYSRKSTNRGVGRTVRLCRGCHGLLGKELGKR